MTVLLVPSSAGAAATETQSEALRFVSCWRANVVWEEDRVGRTANPHARTPALLCQRPGSATLTQIADFVASAGFVRLP